MPRPQPSLPTDPPPCSEHGTRCYQVVVWVRDEHGEDWWGLDHPALDQWAQEIAIQERKAVLGYDKRDLGRAGEGLTCSGPAVAVANLVGALKRAWWDLKLRLKVAEIERHTGGAD